MFPDDLLESARTIIAAYTKQRLRIATAESCTGGLIAGLLTEIPGSSEVVDRGFVTYSNAAKVDMLAVSSALIETQGAVSPEVARAMALGALNNAPKADVAIAVTGIAGPGGGSAEKPVGLVYLALAERRRDSCLIERLALGDIGRYGVRMATLRTACQLLVTAASHMEVGS